MTPRKEHRGVNTKLIVWIVVALAACVVVALLIVPAAGLTGRGARPGTAAGGAAAADATGGKPVLIEFYTDS
jgi:hypothetical protein